MLTGPGVVALETLPSNFPNVQWCCVYFVDNLSWSCDIIISHLRQRKTCQQFLHGLSWYIVGVAVRQNCVLSQQSVKNQLDAFKVTFVRCNSCWGLTKGTCRLGLFHIKVSSAGLLFFSRSTIFGVSSNLHVENYQYTTCQIPSRAQTWE